MSVQMRKIDVHVHVGDYSVAMIRDTGLDGLARMMERTNIKVSCISHTDSVFHDMVGGNRRLFSALERYPQMRGYIYVDPLRPDAAIAEIAKYADHPQVVGIKSRSEYHGVPFNHPDYVRIFRVAEERGMPMLHHTFSLEVARQMAAVVGQLKMDFIVAHSGGGAWRSVVPLLAEFDNTYFDLCASIIESDKASTIAKMVGAERMILGTDANLINPIWTVGMFESAGLSEADLQLIYWDTPNRVLRLGLE
ncbi:MAG: amidohydrolase family protein [Anaerolineae bacterium]